MLIRLRHIILTCGLLCAALAPVSALSAAPGSEQKITEENWKRHPKIVEVRKLYSEIQSQLQHKKLSFYKKSYTRFSRECRGIYPVEYVGIAKDGLGRVRMFVFAQRISDEALLTIWQYYDKDGHLRFVDRTNQLAGFVPTEDRIYLTREGRAFWDVSTEGKKSTFGEETREHYENYHFELTAHEALAIYNGYDLKNFKCAKRDKNGNYGEAQY